MDKKQNRPVNPNLRAKIFNEKLRSIKVNLINFKFKINYKIKTNLINWDS